MLSREDHYRYKRPPRASEAYRLAWDRLPEPLVALNQRINEHSLRYAGYQVDLFPASVILAEAQGYHVPANAVSRSEKIELLAAREEAKIAALYAAEREVSREIDRLFWEAVEELTPGAHYEHNSFDEYWKRYMNQYGRFPSGAEK